MGNLTFCKVSKVFAANTPRQKTALDNLDLEVNSGELLVVLGPSGCGKTTLLRLAAGLERLTSGEILLNGKSIESLAPNKRPFALVFQNYALYPHLTAEQNMTYVLRAQKTSPTEIQKRLQETIDLLRLDKQELKRKPDQLSGGQRQRVALGKAIMRKPDIFFLDEPLSNLDQKLRMHLRRELRRIQRALGATMLLVTHDQMEAAALGDRIALINEGKVEQVGKPMDLYNRPANMFVAEFMANPAMNLIQGSWFHRDGRLLFREKGPGAVCLPFIDNWELKAADYGKKEVVLGIMPEFVRFSPSSNTNQGHGRVQTLHLEPCGPIAYLHMDTGSHQISCVVDPATKLAGNGKVDLLFDMEKILFFDPVSGVRIDAGDPSPNIAHGPRL